MFTWPTIVKKPKGKNILVLAPHMDDEIIGSGGVICKHIQNGDSVAVVYFTCGDKGKAIEKMCLFVLSVDFCV